MIDITNSTERCFALQDECIATLNECKCPFYKPEGCEDWIRIEKDNKVWIMPPEEYFALRAKGE